MLKHIVFSIVIMFSFSALATQRTPGCSSIEKDPKIVIRDCTIHIKNRVKTKRLYYGNISIAYYLRARAFQNIDNIDYAILDYKSSLKYINYVKLHEEKIKNLQHIKNIRQDIAVNMTILYLKKKKDSLALINYLEITQVKKYEAFSFRAYLYTVLKKYELAVNDYETSYELMPNKEVGGISYNGLAWCYFKLGKPEKGLIFANKAIKLNPNLATSYDTRGNIFVAMNRPQDAIEDFGKAIKMGIKLSTTYYGRGMAYEQIGIRDRAISDYLEALKLNPQDEDQLHAVKMAKRRILLLSGHQTPKNSDINADINSQHQ